MTSFYDEKDLEEELSRVNCPDEDLQFEYLFEYEPPCSDFAGGDQGLSDAFCVSVWRVDSSLLLSAQSSVMSCEFYSCEWKRKNRK